MTVTQDTTAPQSSTGSIPVAMHCQVDSVEEAWQILEVGTQSRHSAHTKMNERSSRSHCMLRVKVRGQSKLTGEHLVFLLLVVGCSCLDAVQWDIESMQWNGTSNPNLIRSQVEGLKLRVSSWGSQTLDPKTCV